MFVAVTTIIGAKASISRSRNEEAGRGQTSAEDVHDSSSQASLPRASLESQYNAPQRGLTNAVLRVLGFFTSVHIRSSRHCPPGARRHIPAQRGALWRGTCSLPQRY